MIVLPGREDVERHLTGGIELKGKLSEPLLLSIFDASSPGHDGAILVRDGSVERFAVHLPLSDDRESLGPRGTRHAAALGLSERCDAIVIAVSEERGTISVARDGRLIVLDRPEELIRHVREARNAESPGEPFLQRRDFRDAALAVAGAVALWMLMVPRLRNSRAHGRRRDPGRESAREPGARHSRPTPRRDRLARPSSGSLLAERTPITIQIDAYLARLGRRTFTIENSAVKRPASLSVLAIAPEKVRLSLEPAPIVEPDVPAVPSNPDETPINQALPPGANSTTE